MRPRTPGLALVAVAGLVACGAPAAERPAGPVVETALPTPQPSEPGCDGEPVPARTASVTLLSPQGEVTWSRALPTDDAPGGVPPLVHGGSTYVLAGGTLRSYDTQTGQERFVVEAAGARYGLWRNGDTLVLLLDQVSESARVVGMHAEDGRELWTHELPGNGLLGDQILTEQGDLVMILGGGRLQVLDTGTGSVRWTADQGGAPYIAVAADLVLQSGVGTLSAYRLEDGSRAWSVPTPADVAVTPAEGVVLTEPTVIGPGVDTAVTAFDPATGEQLWVRRERRPLPVLGSDERVLLLGQEGTTEPDLIAVDPRTGDQRWAVNAGIVYGRDVLVQAESVVVAQRRGESYSVARRSVESGEVLAEEPLPHELQPWSLDTDRFLVQSFTGHEEDQQVSAHSVETGEQLWSAEVRHAGERPVVVADGSVVVTGQDPFRGCI